MHQQTNTATPHPSSKVKLQGRWAILEFLKSTQLAHLLEAPAEGLALALDALSEQVLHIGGHILSPIFSRHCHLASVLYEIHHHIGLPKIRLLLHLRNQKETSQQISSKKITYVGSLM